MSNLKGYVGLVEDLAQGEGITAIAKIVLDARLFALVDENETCINWPAGKIQQLYDDVNKAWEPYGSLPSLLSPELWQKHKKLYDDAILAARESGWDPDQDLENDR